MEWFNIAALLTLKDLLCASFYKTHINKM